MNITISHIAEAVLEAPGVESGSIVHTIAKDHFPYQKNEGGSGYKHKTSHREEFTVFLRTGKAVDTDNPMRGKIHYTATGENLMECAREALTKVGIPLPLLLQPKTETKKATK